MICTADIRTLAIEGPMSLETASTAQPKNERLEARVTSAQKRIISHAAEIRGTSITDLIVGSVMESATKTIQDHNVLTLNEEASRVFAEALLNPPAPNTRAKAAWRRYRKRVAR